jgi:hypothetical protein
VRRQEENDKGTHTICNNISYEKKVKWFQGAL